MKGWTIAAIFIVFFGVYAHLDYAWGTKIIQKNKMQLVIAKKDWSLAKPWTWFVQPINKVVWLKQYFVLTNPYVVADIVYIEKGGAYKELSIVINLKDKTMTFEDAREVVASGPWNKKFKWVKAPQGIYKDLIEFMLQSADKAK